MANADTEASKLDDDQAGANVKSMSPAAVRQLKDQLDSTKSELQQALDVQKDLATKTAELQMENHELTRKFSELEKKSTKYETLLYDMQQKMMALQMKLAGMQ